MSIDKIFFSIVMPLMLSLCVWLSACNKGDDFPQAPAGQFAISVNGTDYTGTMLGLKGENYFPNIDADEILTLTGLSTQDTLALTIILDGPFDPHTEELRNLDAGQNQPIAASVAILLIGTRVGANSKSGSITITDISNGGNGANFVSGNFEFEGENDFDKTETVRVQGSFKDIIYAE